MSIDPEEAYAEYGRQVYEAQLAEEIIAEFSAERLTSYYTTRGVDLRPREANRRAQALLTVDATASFLFAAIAAETLVRNVLVRPLLYGLVHTEKAADLVLSLVVRDNRGLREFHKLLRQVLMDLLQLDLETYCRAPSLPPLWTEFMDTATKRNLIVHHGVMVDQRDAELAIARFKGWGQIANRVLLDALKLSVDAETGQATFQSARRYRTFTYTE